MLIDIIYTIVAIIVAGVAVFIMLTVDKDDDSGKPPYQDLVQ